MSKGIEALNKINSGAVAVHTPYEGWQDENIRVYYAEEFNIVEKELKALEIIKETFKITFNDEELTIGIDDVCFSTFKEKAKYDLLKEVLINEKETS